MKWVLNYLKGTQNLELTLSANNDGVITWYVNASYAVHGDCKGQSGAMMILEQEAVRSLPWKQKLIAKSSIKAELLLASITPARSSCDSARFLALASKMARPLSLASGPTF